MNRWFIGRTHESRGAETAAYVYAVCVWPGGWWWCEWVYVMQLGVRVECECECVRVDGCEYGGGDVVMWGAGEEGGRTKN